MNRARLFAISNFLLVISFFLVTSVHAGVIRHDTPLSIHEDLAQLPEFASVGRIVGSVGSSGFLCSGTVISSNWVLTAGHCVDEADSLEFHEFDASGGFTSHRATHWFAHENWSPDVDLFGGWDIGLMRFDSAFSTPAATLYNGDDDILTTSVHVGFGLTGDGTTGAQGGAGVKRAGLNIIDDRWSTEGSGDQLLWSDFDHPTDDTFNFFDFPGFTFDDLAIDLEYGVAPGDSGGGLFILDQDDQFKLAGVHSFFADAIQDGLDMGYGDIFASTRVSNFVDWIETSIASFSVSEPSLLFLGTLVLFLMRRRIC